MVTSAVIYWALHALSLVVHIRDVCVMTAPFFASNTAMVAYFFGKEIRDSGTGLIAAIFLAICPGYISRSVAGSYDYECIAIFAMILTFFLFVKAVNTGSLAWAAGAALTYFYMAASWGGYIFIINLIPIYVVVLLITVRYTPRLYIAYNAFYIIGMLLAMQIRFIGFQHVQSSEHMAALGTFCLIQVFYFVDWVKHQLADPKLFRTFLRVVVFSFGGVGSLAFAVGMATGYISPWTGRFYSLLDPTYAKDNIPIIASVSEHQPTAWSSFFFDFHILLILFPAGLYFCFKRLNDASMFVIIYGLTAMYFAGVMVRLILVATPALCLLGAVAVSASLSRLSAIAREKTPEPAASAAAAPSSGKLSGKARDKLKVSGDAWTEHWACHVSVAALASCIHATHPSLPFIFASQPLPLPFRPRPPSARHRGAQDSSLPYQKEGAVVLIAGIFFCLISFARHCTWVTSEAYSSPSIVLMARQHNGDRVIFDDFREAYFWLKHNTKPDAKVMSWWDYGYQITAMANRTVIVDNNTWNNTHIATVGRAMASYEEQAYGIMQQLDVDYVLVVFGGVTGYSSDDINKFLWMVRIGGGVFPDIKEPDYLNNGDYRTDANGSPKMLNCLMYKMCYYRFGELQTEYGKPTGWDRARGYEIGNKDIELEYIEEAFTLPSSAFPPSLSPPPFTSHRWDRARGYEIGNKDIELEYIEEAFTSANWIVRIYRVKQPDNRW
ncbi:unnamed protein product [Closterium sp. Naga37s-1]|nr:unnamed protein product [Closterium sp. Naga37s-1]